MKNTISIPVYSLSECLPTVQDMIKRVLVKAKDENFKGVVYFSDFGIKID